MRLRSILIAAAVVLAAAPSHARGQQRVALPRAFYVRPGLGFGDNGYAVERVEANDSVTRIVRYDHGLAAGLALGGTVRVTRTVPVALEAAALWSQGGDHTGDRWAVGIQLVPLLRF